MVPQGANMEAPSPSNGNHEKLGRRQRAWPLIRRTPQGEPGVSEFSHHALQNLKTQAGLPTAAGPSKLEPKMLHFHASISARFFSC